MPSLDYAEFLSSKVLFAEATGIAVSPDALHPSLFDYQRDIALWAIHRGRAAVFLDTGLGKTRISLTFAQSLAAERGRRALVICPLSVIDEFQDEAAAMDTSIQAAGSMADIDAERGLWVTNYEKAHKFEARAFDAVVLDECFTADTPVDCVDSAGRVCQRPICDVRPGDLILNASGIDVVSDVHRREVPYAIKVKADGQEIISSPNHPYFTQRGWVGAQDLEPGDHIITTNETVRMVRESFSGRYESPQAEKILQSVLLSEMAYETARNPSQNPQPRGCRQAWQETQRVVQIRHPGSPESIGAHSQSQANEEPRNAQESIPHIASDEPRTFRAWGQWHWLDRAAIEDAGGTWERLGSGIHFITGTTDSRLSHTLQARLGERRAKSVYRGGWALAPQSQETGCEEREQTALVRVDGIEVLELGHPRLDRFRDADGKLYFYDIGATQHPSFSINGLLVHNSSILKSLDSKTRIALTRQWQRTPYKLCATATPAPNDTKELVNHAEFLGIMSRKEVFATFFINESKGKGRKKKLVTRLKHHAVDAFYRWLSSWAIAARQPSDLGYSDAGHELPPLNFHDYEVETGWVNDGQLVFTTLSGVSERAQVRRETLAERVAKAAALVNETEGQWIIWHHLNEEGYLLHDAISDCVLIEGRMSAQDKAEGFRRFKSGAVRVLITKPTIGGFGVNLQNSHQQVWCGINDSFEQFYQGIGRQHRHGQQQPVDVHVILADVQRAIWENIRRKRLDHEAMIQQLVDRLHSKAELERQRDDYRTDVVAGERWTLYLGDSCDPCGPMAEIADNSIGLSVHSPPFIARYAYSATERDLGNSRGTQEFMSHYRYQIRELLRVTMPGRSACVHVQNVRTTKRDSGTHPGLIDFRGEVIRAFIAEGWVWVHEITVDKNAQIQAKRKHHQGLLYKTKNSDSAKLSGALADYLLVFRKPGDNPDPIDDCDVADEVWNVWARPVWYHIDEIDVLDTQIARADDDEMHLAPLQKEFIRRCIRLWSKRGELIFDPFNGVGSTGVVAIEQGRGYVGIELKPNYYETAIKNLEEAEFKARQVDLFQFAGLEVEER